MGWFQAIIEGFSAIKEIAKDIKLFIGYLEKAERAGWFERNDAAFRPLIKGPTTKEQKDAAAKAIADSVRGL